jgi:hypothetical protein
MKVSAHPVLVAVALGLLGPNALAEDAEEVVEGRPDEVCAGCTCERGVASSAPMPATTAPEACERLRTADEQAMDEAVAKLWSRWVQAV